VQGISFSVKSDVEQVLRALNELQRNVVPQAVQASLNSAMKSTHTAVVRDLSNELRVKQKYVRKKVRFQRRDRASKYKWEAGVFTVLSDFSAGAFGKPRQLKRGAKVGRYSFPGTFVATMEGKGSKPQIWIRKGKKRLHIKMVRIPVREKIDAAARRAIDRVGLPMFRKRFDHELQYRLRKAGL